MQLVDPRAFDLNALRRLDDKMMRRLNILYLAHNASHGALRDQVSQFDRVSTTPRKIARMFGGRPSSYPAHPVVVVLRGPFDVKIRRLGCTATPQVCPWPHGRWEYLAFVLDPDVSLAGHVPHGAIAWLEKAPAGTAFPDLHRLGNVIHALLEALER